MQALNIRRSSYRARHLAKSHQNRRPRTLALAAAGATTLTLAIPSGVQAGTPASTTNQTSKTAPNQTGAGATSHRPAGPKKAAPPQAAAALTLTPPEPTSSVPGPVVPAPHPENVPDDVKAARLAAERRAEDARLAAVERERVLGWTSAMKSGTYRFTSDYGMRWGRLHAGVDLAAPVGTPVYSMSSGVVKEVKTAGGYGNLLVIGYWDGTVSYYGHLQAVKVAKGAKVAKGQLVALSGNTGRSTGPHLHWEIRPPVATQTTSAATKVKNSVTTGAAGGDSLVDAAAKDPYVLAGQENPTVDPEPWLAQRRIVLDTSKKP